MAGKKAREQDGRIGKKVMGEEWDKTGEERREVNGWERESKEIETNEWEKKIGRERKWKAQQWKKMDGRVRMENMKQDEKIWKRRKD